MILNVTKLVKKYRIPILNIICRHLVFLCGADIPRSVKIGKNVKFCHNAIGTVIHPDCVIEDNVHIYQNVTIGSANVFIHEKEKIKFTIKKGAIICAGAKILAKENLIIAENSVVGANAVLLNSTGPCEIWAGVPAKLIGYRKDLIQK